MASRVKVVELKQGNTGKQQTIVGRHSDLASKHRGH